MTMSKTTPLKDEPLDHVPMQPEVGDVELLPAYSAEDARAALWRIDFFILPVLAIGYMLQFLDKMSLTYASIMGIIEDLHLLGSNYSWSSSVVYLSQLAFSYPATVLLVKFSVVKTVSCAIMFWAAAVLFHAVCHNFGGLMAVRFFLGAGESFVTPAFGMIVAAYYKREEQGLRQCLWFLGNGISGLFGSLVAYGIAHIDASLSQWKILFLIFGGLTLVWGLFMFFAVPDTPRNAWFLKPHQREAALSRLAKTVGEEDKTFRIYQTWEALRDPSVWFFAGYTICIGIANGGLASFSSLIIKGFGYSVIQTYLLQMSVYGSQMVFVLIGAIVPRYVKNCRYILMVLFLIVALVGCVLIHVVPQQFKEARLGALCLTVAFVPIFPLNIAVATTNFKGNSKKATVLAIMMISYCAGNVIGPQFYLPRQAPGYQMGIMSAISCLALASFFVLCKLTLLMWRNNRRDHMDVLVGEELPEVVMGDKDIQISRDNIVVTLDQTDLEDLTFRYIL